MFQVVGVSLQIRARGRVLVGLMRVRDVLEAALASELARCSRTCSGNPLMWIKVVHLT
jgi:hypothetical protein